jgi:hypothetical protein
MALSKRAQNTGAVISMLAITLLLTYMVIPLLGFDNEMVLLSGMGIALLSSVCFCLLLLRKYRKAQQPFTIDYLNVGAQRYVLAILMILYGIDKILGNFFDYQLFALDSKLADVSEFQLAWFFYGKNRWQELFAGLMEFVPALFLFNRRSYYVAAMILLPVTGQVFLLNLFFKIGGLTFPFACILLACNIYILYSQKEAILQFFKSLKFYGADLAGTAKTVVKVLKVTGIALACFFVFVKVKPALFKSAYQQKYQRLVGIYTLKDMKKNGLPFTPVQDSIYYKDLYVEKQDRWNILRRFDNETEAFALKLNTRNDSMNLFLNKGGIGDGADRLDSATALCGVYMLNGKYLTLKGIQLGDTLELTYERLDHIKPKQWFW